MIPIFLVKGSNPTSDYFTASYADTPFTMKQYHYHEGYELFYNIENSGVRCVGDSIERYGKNELILIGPKIPHFWHNDENYLPDDPDSETKEVLVQFGEDFLSNIIMSFREFSDLKNLLNRAARGIQIRGPEAKIIGEKMFILSSLKGWKRVLMIIEILSLMNEAKDYRLLSSTSFSEDYKNGNEEKISKIFNLMVANYNHDLTLEEVAESANMCVSAFCRFFKRNTTKTFSQLLNEIRIGFACKSLIYTENSISEIAFNSGYNNVPYFNRQFKRLKEVTPNEYRQKYLRMLV